MNRFVTSRCHFSSFSRLDFVPESRFMWFIRIFFRLHATTVTTSFATYTAQTTRAMSISPSKISCRNVLSAPNTFSSKPMKMSTSRFLMISDPLTPLSASHISQPASHRRFDEPEASFLLSQVDEHIKSGCLAGLLNLSPKRKKSCALKGCHRNELVPFTCAQASENVAHWLYDRDTCFP